MLLAYPAASYGECARNALSLTRGAGRRRESRLQFFLGPSRARCPPTSGFGSFELLDIAPKLSRNGYDLIS